MFLYVENYFENLSMVHAVPDYKWDEEYYQRVWIQRTQDTFLPNPKMARSGSGIYKLELDIYPFSSRCLGSPALCSISLPDNQAAQKVEHQHAEHGVRRKLLHS